MRQISSLIISFSVIVPVLCHAAFTDVSIRHQFYDSVQWAKGNDIVHGYADGTFRPDAMINRAELAKIVIGSNFLSAAIALCDPNHIYSFSDAGRDEWYSQHLCVAVQHEIVGGYADGTFRPANNINFVEAAKIIAIVSQYKNGVGRSDGHRFVLQTGQHWFEPYVDYLVSQNAVPDSIVHYDQFITRGEMVEMMYRLSKPHDTIGHVRDNWKTYEDIHGFFTMQLPGDWKALSPYDGSYLPFTKLGDGVLAYGSTDGKQEIYLEILRKEDIHLQSDETLLSFATNRFRSEKHNYNFRSRSEDGYVHHDLIMLDPDPEYAITSYVFYERDDVIVVLGYDVPSTTTTAIQSSFRFTPKDLLR